MLHPKPNIPSWQMRTSSLGSVNYNGRIKRIIHRLGIALFCIGFIFSGYAQDQHFIDSLQTALAHPKNTNHKIDILNDLAWEFKVEAPEKARQHLENSISLAIKAGYKKGEAQAYNNRGVVETIAGNYDDAIPFYQKALTLREELGDRKGVASLYNNIGNIKGDMGKPYEALENLKNSLYIREELNDSLRTARCNYNIGIVHESLGDYPEAEKYILRHLSYFEFVGDKYEIANGYNVLGNINRELELLPKAIEHFKKAMSLREELGYDWELAMVYQNMGAAKDELGEQLLDSIEFDRAFTSFQESLDLYQKAIKKYEAVEDLTGVSASYNNIGLVYKNLGDYYQQTDRTKVKETYAQALQYLNQSLEMSTASEDKRRIMEVYNGIGDVYRRKNDTQAAIDFAYKYLAIAEELNDEKFMQGAYRDLSRGYSDQKKYQKAFEFEKKYNALRHERMNMERSRQLAGQRAAFGDFQKDMENKEQKQQLVLQESELRSASILRNSLIGGAFGLLLLAALLYNRYRIKHRANISLAEKNTIIEKERERSDNLLLNILPKETAEELKQYGKTKAKYYESVTVLFTDFKSFTQIAEQLKPEELVAELDYCFRAFDEITSKFGIEKIKTIGDAYMCAGGIPVSNESHAVDAVNAALEIQFFMRQLQMERQRAGKPAFETRIGLHTGPVVAGIVGSKKFAYDIWGDTVNMAARMESSGATGKVNVSESTYSLVKDQFHCEHRGKIKAKNKGEVDMYFVSKP